MDNRGISIAIRGLLFFRRISALAPLLLFPTACRPPAVEKTAAPSLPEPPAAWRDTVAASVLPGETLDAIFHDLDLAGEEFQALLGGVREHFRFPIHAGQIYRAVFQRRADQLRLQSFILEARAGDSLHVLDRVDPNVSSPVGEGEPGGVIAFQYAEKEIPVRVDTVAVSGELRGNLFDSFLAMGEQPVLVDEMIRIFAWDIDFFRDPRTGDVFQVLMEKRFAPAGRFLGYGEVLAARYENAGRAFDAVRYQGRYFASDGRSLEKQLMKAPLRFSSISSGFSHARLHPILGVKRPHWGVDYVAPAGTPIFAAGDGMVVYAKWCGGYGRTVKIRHNGVYNTYYGHLQGYADAIAAGTRVSQGQVIAYLGMSGLATGPHLDYRVERNGAYVNPRTLVSEALAGVPASDFPAFGAQRDRMLARMGGSVSTRLARRSAGNVSKSKGEGS